MLTPNQPGQPPKPRDLTFKVFLILLFIGFSVGSVITIVSLRASPNPTYLSPISALTHILGTTSRQTDKIIYGFLPYWQFKSADTLSYDLLTHLALFGIDVGQDGNFITRELNYTEPGWAALHSDTFAAIKIKAKSSGTKLILTLRAFDSDNIDTLLSNSSAQDLLITNTLDYLETEGLDGINLDFEYVAEANDTTRAAFTQFVSRFTQALKAKNPAYHVSLDVFADAGDNHRIWQINELTQIVDHLIIMAYDYHRPSSPLAGPVAPLYGAGQFWDEDITSALSIFVSHSPPYKFLLGIPFYGYEWRTTSSQELSQTYPKSGSLATYHRVKQFLENHPETIVNWNLYSLSPWFTYQEDDQTWQIYYEDTRSLGIKYDLANQAGLGGIAIWALGYDAGSPELWEQIHQKFY